jgi:hypothetical protein
LPGTSNNNSLLGNIFEFNNANYTDTSSPNVAYNYNASKTAKCSIVVDGMTVIKGVFKLLEIIIDGKNIEYECSVIGELGGLSMKLGAKKIQELDFSAYNHAYTIANITGSWTNENAGAGYYYPLIDYGNVSAYSTNAQLQGRRNKIDYEVRALRPALFVKDYINKIITEAGYTWESNFFNTDFFKRLVIPYNEKVFTKRNTSNYFNAERTPNFLINANVNNPDVTRYIPLPTYVLTSNFSVNAAKTFFTFTGSFDTTVKIKGKIEGFTTGNINNTYNVGVSRTGGVLDWAIETGVNGSFSYSFNETIIIRPGESIGTYGNVFLELGTSASITITNVTLDVSPTLTSFIEYQIGNTIDINGIIPKNIYQKDFFTSILKMFYLMVTEDKFKPRHFIIEPWVDFYDNDRTTYLDWTDKVDLNKVIKISPMSEANFRTYQLNYKDDNDFYNETYKKRYNQGYGQMNYDNMLEFSKETSKTEVIFSPTALVGYDGIEKIVSTIFKKTNNVEEAIDHNIRILQAKKISLTESYNVTITTYLGGTQTYISNLTNYGYAGHLNDPFNCSSDINFGALREVFFTFTQGNLSNNLFNAYYSSYLAEITDKDSRLVTVTIRLKDNDIFNLDFGRYILIDQVLYRLNKIKDYVTNELCEVELLRVISTNYR